MFSTLLLEDHTRTGLQASWFQPQNDSLLFLGSLVFAMRSPSYWQPSCCTFGMHHTKLIVYSKSNSIKLCQNGNGW
jgi:hypothetical protein